MDKFIWEKLGGEQVQRCTCTTLHSSVYHGAAEKVNKHISELLHKTKNTLKMRLYQMVSNTCTLLRFIVQSMFLNWVAQLINFFENFIIIFYFLKITLIFRKFYSWFTVSWICISYDTHFQKIIMVCYVHF